MGYNGVVTDECTRNVSSHFVERLYEMTHSTFPKRIEQKARECLLDYIAVTLGGAQTYTEINLDFIRRNKMIGDCHIIGSPTTTDLRTAVMINAFHAHVLELDDSHRSAMTHLGAPICSALMGVAEIYGCTMVQLCHAIVVGYEAAIRLANSIQPSHKKRGFHVSGTCCTVGCAMGIASMLDYSLEQMQNVLSAAATSAAGLLAVISGNSEQKPYNIANAAMAGVNAALYGKYYYGATDILGDSRGYLRAMCDEYDVSRLFDDGYAIEGIYQKLYAACRHCHAPMEAMLLLTDEHHVNAADIDNIEVRTYDLAIKGHDHVSIQGVSSAKQSIPYGVAAAVVYHDCGIEAFAQNRVIDENVLELTRKVVVKEDQALSALVPDKRAAVVTVRLRDGIQYEQKVDYPKGEPENPITQDEMADKFYTLIQKAGINQDTGLQIYNYIMRADHEMAGGLYQWISINDKGRAVI